ncbi:GNAT family N-acetyltransferase [[Clostridium] polysaccharolyticum]|uniref:Acetyltransferase (GNAT) domain-containing protein n=1 Tax=[Clostridium] polysaccharolyticum TaxID=29364 RepID=A0A1I0FLF0_9FIRM|nr:GNAT family N-acetyltransferase [[Clostridium] polysaccharolyticum]SET58877.1 Acetyltransferase (GNAT) domain-containing protein [[Clostridium] polysaccharolyticum]
MITNATKAMVPAMKEMWAVNFGDSDEYISFFFENHLKLDEKGMYQNQFVYQLNGQPVSMLSVLEAQLDNGQHKQEFWYIYAVVTAKEHRRKGYAGKVLLHVIELAKKKEIAVGLVPADEGLYRYYGKFGFESFFYNRTVKMNLLAGDGLADGWKLATAEQYKMMRDQFLANQGAVIWEKQAVEYAIKENENLGGKTYYLENTSYFLMVCPLEGKLIVRETNLPWDVLKNVCDSLAERFQCNTAFAVAPVGTWSQGAVVKHGMICNLGKSFSSLAGQSHVTEFYLGLALD